MKHLNRTLIMAALGLPSAAAALTLAQRGQPPECAIVLPAEASPSQRYAAEELRRFTEQMTGVALPITADTAPLPPRAVLLGMTQYTAELAGAVDIGQLGDDGFILKSSGERLCIIGSRVRGTLYGVYELLEKHGGCRWYSSWHSRIPKLDKWEIPELNATHTPAFAVREPFWFDMFKGDFAARSRCNGNRHELTERHGGKIRFGSGMFVHTFNSLCPPDKYFETHPEYFSELGGRRVKEHSQLCLTNPEVLKIVTENLLAGIRKDPTAKLFSVSQNDWYNFCTCPVCKAIDDREGSHAGTMISFVNQVAEAVEKEFPNVWIETLAYQYTRKPPKTVRPRHNVVPRLCTIECDFSKPLNQSLFAQNKKFVEEIRIWSGMTDKLYIWDYTTNFRNYTGPFPNVLALQDNVRFFRDNKVVGVFEQGAYQGRHGDFAELKAWLLAKWLWNPELDFETLMTDFLEGYYGKAAPIIREYFNGVHAFYQDTERKPLLIFEDITKSDIPDEFLTRAATLWRQAEQAVMDSPTHSYNVRMGAVPVLHALLARQAKHDALKVWVTRHPENFLPTPEQRTLAAALVSRFDEAKNIRLSESMEHHDKTLAYWRTLADPLPPPAPADRVTVEDTQLSLGNRGTWGDTVSDPLAADGSAMKLYNNHYEWCTTLQFRNVAFDRGQKYRLRMRVRVEKKPGLDGEAFWAGVYDAGNKRSCGGAERKTTQVGDDYEWYDVAEWVPDTAHYFWIGPGRFDKESGSSAIKALYIDRVDIERVD
jgi:hypothetical protein